MNATKPPPFDQRCVRPVDEARQFGALRVPLTIAGIVEAAVGVLHFFMPGQYRQSAGLSNLVSAEADFVVLVTFAVGILLVSFGALTLFFARHPQRWPEIVYVYLLVSVALWVGRLALELLYPIKLRMFGVEPFTAIVTPGVAAEVAILGYALWHARRNVGLAI